MSGVIVSFGLLFRGRPNDIGVIRKYSAAGAVPYERWLYQEGSTLLSKYAEYEGDKTGSFDMQLALGVTPIERVSIPLKSRDELPPILVSLQWIFQTPEINEQVFCLLQSKVIAGKKATGRPGLDLWQILVLGVVRLGLDCDYDRLS